eukprot:g16453.t1
MLGMFEAEEQEQERDTYGSPTRVPPLQPTPQAPPSPVPAPPNEYDSSSASAIWSTRTPAAAAYSLPTPISWMPDDGYAPVDSSAATAAPTAGGDSSSTPWPTPPRGIHTTAPSPAAPSSQGAYPPRPTEPPVFVAVPKPSLPAESPTRSPSSTPAPGIRGSQGSATLNTDTPSHGINNTGNSNTGSPAPSSGPAGSAKEALVGNEGARRSGLCAVVRSVGSTHECTHTGSSTEAATAAPAVVSGTAFPTVGTQGPTAIESRGLPGSASPTAASFDRGFVGTTLAPALPWLESTFGPTSLLASASSSTATPASSPPPADDSFAPPGQPSSAPSPSPTSANSTAVPQTSLASTPSPTDDTSTPPGQPSSSASPAPSGGGFSSSVGQASTPPSPSPTFATSPSREQPSSSASPAPTPKSGDTFEGQASSAPSELQQASAPTPGPNPGSRDFTWVTASPTGSTTLPPTQLFPASASPTMIDERVPPSSAPTTGLTPGDRGFADNTSSPTGAAGPVATVPPSDVFTASASPTTLDGGNVGGADQPTVFPTPAPAPAHTRLPSASSAPTSGGNGTIGAPTAGPTAAATGFGATVSPSPIISASPSPTTIEDRGFGGAGPWSLTPTSSPSPGDRGFAEITSSPTGATGPAATVPPSDIFTASASPTTPGGENVRGIDQPTVYPTPAPAPAHTGPPGSSSAPTSGGSGTIGAPTAGPTAAVTGSGPVIRGGGETTYPLTMYPTPAPTTSPDGQSQLDGGFEGTDYYDDDDPTDDGGIRPPTPTAAPSAAPTFAIDGDASIDREGGGDVSTTPTPAPTDHAEDLWDWWHQEGSPRADRGQALATGSGEHADLRFLVGTEDGVVAIDPEESLGTTVATSGLENPSRRRRQRRRRKLQSDTGSGQDVSVVCLSTAGEDLWHKSMGSAGEDVALCAAASQEHVFIAGHTTGDLFAENNGEDDAFLSAMEPADGGFLGGWQFGGEGSERVYALALDEDSGDIIVGGYTTGSLFSTNDNGISQYFVARLNKNELLLSPTGLLDLSDERSLDVVMWGWQYSTPATVPEAIVSVMVDSTRGIVTALGSRGLPPEWSPRDPDFVPEDRNDLSSVVLFLNLETGELLLTSIRLHSSLGTAVAVDRETGDAYVAGFAASPDDETGDEVVVHKVLAETGAKGWSYAATSEGVSVGRALAINVVGETDIVVAGTTSGAGAYPSAGETDIFSLMLSTEDGSETCYYQVGTNSTDVVTGISVDNSGTGVFPDVAIGGFTGGSLAAPNGKYLETFLMFCAGETDVFAIGVNFELFCPDIGRSTPNAAKAEADGSLAAGAVSILAGVAIIGAVVSTVIVPTAAVASTAAAVAGAGAGVGVAAAPTVGAAADAGGTAAVRASACPENAGEVGALVTILSVGHGGGGLSVSGQSPPPGEVTFRSPSASIGLLVMTKLQFLALLSLVPSVHDSTSFLASFVENLRWVNLWLPLPSSMTPEACEIADAEALMDDSVLFGNTTLVLGVLLAIFLVHVAVISADHAKSALKSAQQAYGISATDLALQASARSLSRRGRGRFPAVANGDGSASQGLSPRSPGGDLISFEDLEDSDAQRLRSVFPAPASSVGSMRSPSPPRGTTRRHPNGSPTSPSSCYADDLPSAFAGSQPYAGNAVGNGSPYSPSGALSVWIDNPPEQQHQQQRVVIRSVSASPAGRLRGDGDGTNGSAFSRHDDVASMVGTSHGSGGGAGVLSDILSPKNGPLSSENRSVSPPPGPRLGRPSSIVRRISDKGGGSLPGSPTPGGGGRYGKTGQLYPDQSAVSSVRSASPASLYWDSPPRGSIDGDPNPTRSRICEGGIKSGRDNYNNSDHGDDDGGGFAELFMGAGRIKSLMPVTGAGPRGIPPLAQEMEMAVIISDSGSAFDDGEMVVDPATGLRRRRGKNRSSMAEAGRPGQTSIVVKPTPDGEGDGDDNHPILACRRRSRSMWLHFPHVELLFLFWAFEGAVAAQVSALNKAECPRVFWLALAALLLFPVLMVVMVWRTIVVRVRPNDRLVFRLHGSEGEEGASELLQEGRDDLRSTQPQAEVGGVPPTADDHPEIETGRSQRSLWQKFVSAWFENGMLFSWADTGSWESVATNDKWFGLACVGVLVEDSVKQLLYMFILHAVDLAVLVRVSPFANRVINIMNAMLTAVDGACTALMLMAAGFEEDETATFNNITFVIQLVALIALVIPVYIDTGVSLAILVTEKLSQSCAARDDAEGIKDQQDREYVRRFARRSWPRYWCPMVRHNILAAANDIREGVRAPGKRNIYRSLRQQTERKKLGKAAATPGGGRGCLFRCCGVSAAPTLPVPASASNSCIGGTGGRGGEWSKHDGGDVLHHGGEDGKQQQEPQQGKWTLPPKLRAAAQGAGSWGREAALISSSRSTVARRPPSPTGPAHHRGRGSEVSTAAGSMFTLGEQSDKFGAGSCGGVVGAVGGVSGRGLIPSVFCSTPIPLDEPRKKTFDGTARRSGSLELGGNSTGGVGEHAARGRGGDGASGRGLITSMFSAPSVAIEDSPRRRVCGPGNSNVGSSGDGVEAFSVAGGEDGSVAGAERVETREEEGPVGGG